jgi:hypothetical protein
MMEEAGVLKVRTGKNKKYRCMIVSNYVSGEEGHKTGELPLSP